MAAGLVVLIVDNDRDTREYVHRCVRKHGLKLEAVIQASDGRKALELAKQRRIDLVITDGLMPQLSGFDLCQALRHDERNGSAGILLITGEYQQTEASRNGSRAGADEVLLKPFNASTLCRKIDEVLAKRPPAGSQATGQ